MAHIITGDRVGRQGRLSLATNAVIFDEAGAVLLTQRQDNGLWCLPGGIMEPGESVAEAVIREVAEETGLMVSPVHLIGVYSDPNLLAVYPGGTKHHPVVLCFHCTVVGGVLQLSSETTDVRFFPQDALPSIVGPHYQRLQDARRGGLAAFIR